MLKNFELKNDLGWNCQIVDENKIIDIWYVLMWDFLSIMWMNVEIWNTTIITFYITTLALYKEWKKKPSYSLPFSVSMSLTILSTRLRPCSWLRSFYQNHILLQVWSPWLTSMFFIGNLLSICIKRFGLIPSPWKIHSKISKEIVKKLQIKKNLGWNHQIVDENRITNMWYGLMWYFLSNMWMNVEM